MTVQQRTIVAAGPAPSAATAAFLAADHRLFIGGRWIEASEGGRLDVENPATGEIVARVPAGTAADVDAAVAAARQAFDHGPWSRMTPSERGRLVWKLADLLETHADEFAEIDSIDNGKPVTDARAVDVAFSCELLRYMAGWSTKIHGQTIALSSSAPFHAYTLREPVGVVGQIVPWNFPLMMAVWKVAPALAAGCTIVLKPSELTPLTALELADIADKAGLPAGVLNVVTGFGAAAGQPLADHPGVDKLAFTGSVPTGSRVMQAAARDIKRVSLELGGKSPFLVFADSDVEKAVEWIMFGIFWNQGQVCSATSRVLVERPLYDAVVARLVAESGRITIGNGREAGVLLGPLVSAGQYAKVTAAIERGVAEGARLAAGGKRPAHLPTGYFIEPAVFVDTPPESSVWREEIFGPVVCLAPFETEDEAIRSANDSPFGLAAAVMSDDLARCERVAAKLRAGIVWINCSQPTFTEAPWGGFKQSGIGRELGRWGFENYLEVKQITRFETAEKWGWYIK